MEKAVPSVLLRTSASKDTSAVSSTFLFCAKDPCCYRNTVLACLYNNMNSRSSSSAYHVVCMCVCVCHLVSTYMCVHDMPFTLVYVSLFPLVYTPLCCGVMCVHAHGCTYVRIREWMTVPHCGCSQPVPMYGHFCVGM